MKNLIYFQQLLTIKRILFFSLIMILAILAVIIFGHPNKAHAYPPFPPPVAQAGVCIACIPTDIQQKMAQYDSWHYNSGAADGECAGNPYTTPKLPPYYQQYLNWVSPLGNSSIDGSTPLSAITVTPGTSIQLQYNSLIYQCQFVVQGNPQFCTLAFTAPSASCPNPPNPASSFPSSTMVNPTPFDPLIPDSTHTIWGASPGTYLSNRADYYISNVSTAVPGDGTITDFPGVGAPINDPNATSTPSILFQAGTRFWFPNNQNVEFIWNTPGSLSPGTHELDINMYSVTTFTTSSGNLYTCVKVIGGASTLQTYNYYPSAPTDCSYGISKFFINAVTPFTNVNPPAITGGPSCSSTNISGKATDGDFTGTMTVNYTITGPGVNVSDTTPTTDAAGDYNISMAGYDQLQSYNVTVWLNDYASDGSVITGVHPVAYTNPSPVTYPPCYTASCGTITLNIVGDVNTNNPVPNQPFTLTAIVNIVPIGNGTPATPSTMLSNLNIYFTGLPSQNFANTSSATTTNLSEPNTGTFTYGYVFTDQGITVSTASGGGCTGKTTIVAIHPIFHVTNGDVSSGSGGFGSSCTGTNINAGILAYNLGSTTNSAGSGTDLGAFSPNIVNGFDSNNGDKPPGSSPYTSNYLNGTTFANVGNVPPGNPPFGNSNFGGGFGTSYNKATCVTDYYGTTAAALPSLSNNTLLVPQPTSLIDIANLPPSACKSIGSPATTTYCWFKGPTTITNTSNTIYIGDLIILVKGEVLVADNILVKPDYTLNPIPTIDLIASGNIHIKSNVTQIDGTYIAQPNASPTSGVIYTCSDTVANNYNFYNNGPPQSDSLSTSCNMPLLINGAVIADQVKLGRTHDPANRNGFYCSCDNNPAETFQYAPNVWMVNPFDTGGTLPPNPNYDSLTSLPPVL